MKKTILALSFILLIGLHLCGQPATTSLKNSVNVGYGFTYFNHIVRSFDEAGWILSKNITGPFYLKYHHVIGPHTSFGVNTFFIHMEGVDAYPDTIPFSVNGYGINLSVKFFLYEKIAWLKPYITLGCGFQDFISSANYEYVEIKNDIEFHGTGELSFGLEFLPIRNLGFYGEVGIGTTVFQLGLISRF